MMSSLSPNQQNALERLDTLWNAFVQDEKDNASSEMRDQKLSAVYEHLAALEKDDLIAILQLKRKYDFLGSDPSCPEQFFLSVFATSLSPHFFLKVLDLIPIDHRYSILDQSFYKIDRFISSWFDLLKKSYNLINSHQAWELKNYLDDKSQNLFFSVMCKHAWGVSKFLRAAPDFKSFERLFSAYFSDNKRAYDSDHLLNIFDMGEGQVKKISSRNKDGSLPDSVVKRFLDLTQNSREREEFIFTKISPELRDDFCQALQDYLNRQKTSEESHPVVRSGNSKAIYLMTVTIILFIAAIFLSAFYATATMTACIVGGGALSLGVVWLFTRSREKVTSLKTESHPLVSSSDNQKNTSGSAPERTQIFSGRQIPQGTQDSGHSLQENGFKYAGENRI